MRNQLFSVNNFIKIFYEENRKGIYIEELFFPEVRECSKKIDEFNKTFRNENKIKIYKLLNKKITEEEYKNYKERKNNEKEKLFIKKRENLEKAISLIVDKIFLKKFGIELINGPLVKGKKTIVLNKTPENFFIQKQLQKNISRGFKIKQSNMFEIVCQIKELLNDRFYKYILRTDIKGFYENIPHFRLLNIISDNSLLSPFSKKIIQSILSEYKKITGEDKGIPRGVGVSAYLAEFFMKNIDERIKSLECVTYYARYVDDIMLIFTPENNSDNIDYLDKIKKIFEENNLELNDNKTTIKDLRNDKNNNTFTIEFLGYKYIFKNKSGLKICLSKKKINKYKERIKAALGSYNKESKNNEKKARKLLVGRFRFLTMNTRLLNVKKNILCGIYFSNRLLTNTKDLSNLDKYMKAEIDRNLKPYKKLKIDSNKLKLRLKKFSFEKGFNERLFIIFTKNEIEEIIRVWKYK